MDTETIFYVCQPSGATSKKWISQSSLTNHLLYGTGDYPAGSLVIKAERTTSVDGSTVSITENVIESWDVDDYIAEKERQAQKREDRFYVKSLRRKAKLCTAAADRLERGEGTDNDRHLARRLY